MESTETIHTERAVRLRASGAVGIFSMLFLLAGIAAGPTKLISATSSASAIAADVGAHTGRQAVSGGLVVVGTILFMWFAAALAAQLAASDGGTPLPFAVLGSAVIVFVFGALDNIALTALGFLSRQGNLTAEPQLTGLLYHLYNGLLMPGLAAFGFSLYLATVGLGALRKSVHPSWLAWPSLVIAGLALANGFVGITMTNGGANPAAPLAVLGFVVVTITISIVMLRDPTHAA